MTARDRTLLIDGIGSKPAVEANPSDGGHLRPVAAAEYAAESWHSDGIIFVMGIQYAWHSDDRYYATVVKNQFRQLPLLLHLRSQASIIWIAFSAFTLSSALDFRTKWVLLGFIAAFASIFPLLVKHGIILKYRLRPTFRAETTFRMTENEVVITGPGAGQYPWTVYDRAVRFSDGILLVRKGGIRWLPDTALTEGTSGDAIAIVRNHLPVRELS